MSAKKGQKTSREQRIFHCLPQSEERTVVISKDGHYDVSREHGDCRLLAGHHTLGEVAARAPVEAPGGVVSHLHSELLTVNWDNGLHLAALHNLVIINIDVLARRLPLPELPLAPAAPRLLLDRRGSVDTFEPAEKWIINGVIIHSRKLHSGWKTKETFIGADVRFFKNGRHQSFNLKLQVIFISPVFIFTRSFIRIFVFSIILEFTFSYRW